MKRPYKYLIGLALAAAAPTLFGLIAEYWVHLLFIIVIYAILATSLNIPLGYTGLTNLSQSVLYGAGAYVSANLVMRLGLNFWPTVIISGLTGILVAAIVGVVSLRLKGLYYGLTTFAFLAIMMQVFQGLTDFTGGNQGLYPIPSASWFGHKVGANWLYIALGVLIVVVFVSDELVHSRIGRALIAIREDEDLARSSGVNLFAYKMVAVCFGGFWAGIAGAMYATYAGTIVPADFSLIVMAFILASCILGGSGTLVGPIVGAVVVICLPELLRPLIGNYYYAVFGLLLVGAAIYFPWGVVGGLRLLWKRIRFRQQIGRNPAVAEQAMTSNGEVAGGNE